jgi:hypothetical protein
MTQSEVKILEAQQVFLNVLPLEEIDHPEIRLICQSYRNDNSSLQSCVTLFSKYNSYFENWLTNNQAVETFYFTKR